MDNPQQPTSEELARRVRELETRLAAVSSNEESAERLRAILTTAVEGIITIDEHGTIESMNPAAEQMFGYTEAELLGENVSVLMPSPWREEHDGYLARYLITGQRKVIGVGRKVQGRKKQGGIFPIDLAVSEVRLRHRRIFTGFVRDITEREQAEAQLAELARSLSEKNKELETIVYVASHDLRSPLVNIQGFSRELAEACRKLEQHLRSSEQENATINQLLDGDIHEALFYIQAGVSKMDSLLAGLLQYSRLGRASLKIEPLAMNILLANVARSMEFQIKNADATLHIATVPDAIGDAMQISQVFSNLLENAAKYLDVKRRGEITITGRVEQGQAIYAVKDNGGGIAQAHQSKVFEIFHRLHPEKGEGEGLGLTIAQRIMERHSGRIWLESTPGAGSTFYVSLPAAVSAKMEL